jgi:hypothetical protein
MVERCRPTREEVSAASDFEAGSAVYVKVVRPVSALSSIISNVRLRSSTTALTTCYGCDGATARAENASGWPSAAHIDSRSAPLGRRRAWLGMIP